MTPRFLVQGLSREVRLNPRGRIVGLLSMLLASGWAGCGGEEAQPEAPKATGVPSLTAPSVAPAANTAAPAGPAAPVPAGGKVLDEEGLERLRYLIYMLHQESGRYPANLGETVKAGYIESLPAVPPGKRLDYNSSTGELKLLDAR
jgi:hypothetical protein